MRTRALLPAAAVLLVAAVLAGCGGATTPAVSGPTMEEKAPTTGPAPDCGELPFLTAGSGSAGGTDPGEVQTWASHAAPEAFGGLWIDNDAGGVIVVAFADEVERWEEEADERFGDDVSVVAVAFPMTELEALQHEVGERMSAADNESGSPGGLQHTSIDVRRNRVGIGIVEPSDADRAALTDAYGADRICIEAIPIPGEDDAEVAGWAPVDPGALTPGTTSIPIEVMERGCAGGRPAEGRVATPEVDYREDAVVVTMRVIPVVGAATCPGNPPTPYTLELEEPLGDRVLLDGATDPPSEPQLERH